MITILSDLNEYMLSSDLPELSFNTTSKEANVVLSKGDMVILNEQYVPDSSGVIKLRNLGKLLETYLYENLIETFHYLIKDSTNSIVEKDFKVQYCNVEIGMDTVSFLDSFFLSVLVGDKITSASRKEYLHLVCREETQLTAVVNYRILLSDKTETVPLDLTKITSLNQISTVEVSPELFETNGKVLLGYTVIAGQRKQNYLVDRLNPRFAPSLLFTNSFGCQDTVYCLGIHQLESEYERSMAYIDGKYKAYHINENRKYKANTGILSTEMATWAEDLFRSKEVYLLEQNMPGKEITITESKIVRSNDPDELPSFNFEYRYAQRNHNLFTISKVGRIFDNTFDLSFNRHEQNSFK